MELLLRITAVLLLLVQASHSASPQYSTNSPGRGIDQNWLRELAKDTAGNQNAAAPGDNKTEFDPADGSAVESRNDYSSGIASGMTAGSEEAEMGRDANEGAEDLNAISTTTISSVLDAPTELPQPPDDNASEMNATMDSSNSGQNNTTDAEQEFDNPTTSPQNSTTQPGADNSTSFSRDSNRTDAQPTTSAPEGNATETSTNTTEANEAPATPPSTTFFLLESTETSAATTEDDAPETANKTDEGSASGGGSERGSEKEGLDSDSQRSSRNRAWGAVLGLGAAVGGVGLVAYILLKKRQKKAFSHRKLVEEIHSDPVLRLDNSEPLDLNLGGSAYYNPGLQGDEIQMTHFPGRN